MRSDLDFLYQKAMRSIDSRFINKVCVLLIDALRIDEAEVLGKRLADVLMYIDNDVAYLPFRTKFGFLIDDSQWGADWYRNR